MAAACPELPTATAQEVFLAVGFEAAAGWPLTDGTLPVGMGSKGMVLMTPLEWESYRNLCHGEALTRLAAAA